MANAFKDPVCGKRLHRGRAHIVIEYEGVDYLLCCPQCQAQFERNPKTYARSEFGEKTKKIAGAPQRERHPL